MRSETITIAALLAVSDVHKDGFDIYRSEIYNDSADIYSMNLHEEDSLQDASNKSEIRTQELASWSAELWKENLCNSN